MAEFDKRQERDYLVGLIKQFKQDMISPSGMWVPIFEQLTPESAWGFFASLPGDLQAVIRAEYNGLARYRFLPPHDAEYPELKQVIARWCEEGDA
jgi:hypothetical protein